MARRLWKAVRKPSTSALRSWMATEGAGVVSSALYSSASFRSMVAKLTRCSSVCCSASICSISPRTRADSFFHFEDFLNRPAALSKHVIKARLRVTRVLQPPKQIHVLLSAFLARSSFVRDMTDLLQRGQDR